SITSLEEHLLWGSLLASLVVLFFIRNIRAVIISALAIPASIIATFTLMRAMDFTLNNMTLLGLTLRLRFIHPSGCTRACPVRASMLVVSSLTRMLSSRFLKPSDAEKDHKALERGF